MSGGGGPDDEKSFKSRVSDVFAGLDQVGFKSDSSLKQQDKPKEKVEDKFKEFRRPRSPPGRQGFDRFKRTDSIFQETPDVGSWRQRGDRSGRDEQRRLPPRNKPKNPLYDSRRPQRKDPSKYTKYSLADVKDVTDRSNTAAALDFLDSCRKRRQAEDAAHDDDGPSGSSSKVVFKKPKRAPPPAATADPPPKTEPSSYGLSCGNSKRVMPEAVVGLRPSANKRKTEDKKPAATKAAAAAKKEKKLSHLDFEDDDEDC